MKILTKLFLALTTAAALSTSSLAIAAGKVGIDTDVKPMDRIECGVVNGTWECTIYPR